MPLLELTFFATDKRILCFKFSLMVERSKRYYTSSYGYHTTTGIPNSIDLILAESGT